MTEGRFDAPRGWNDGRGRTLLVGLVVVGHGLAILGGVWLAMTRPELFGRHFGGAAMMITGLMIGMVGFALSRQPALPGRMPVGPLPFLCASAGLLATGAATAGRGTTFGTALLIAGVPLMLAALVLFARARRRGR